MTQVGLKRMARILIGQEGVLFRLQRVYEPGVEAVGSNKYKGIYKKIASGVISSHGLVAKSQEKGLAKTWN